MWGYIKYIIKINITCFFLFFSMATRKFWLYMWLTFVAHIIFLLPSTAVDLTWFTSYVGSLVSIEVSLAIGAFSTIFTTCNVVSWMNLLWKLSHVYDFFSCVDSMVNTEVSSVHKAFPLRSSLWCMFSGACQTEIWLSSRTLHWYCVNPMVLYGQVIPLGFNTFKK